MRKIATVIAITLSLSMGACCSKFDKNTVQQLRNNDEIILPEYLKYVENDASLSKERKDDRKKLVESRKGIIDALEKGAK